MNYNDKDDEMVFFFDDNDEENESEFKPTVIMDETICHMCNKIRSQCDQYNDSPMEKAVKNFINENNK